MNTSLLTAWSTHKRRKVSHKVMLNPSSGLFPGNLVDSAHSLFCWLPETISSLPEIQIPSSPFPLPQTFLHIHILLSSAWKCTFTVNSKLNMGFKHGRNDLKNLQAGFNVQSDGQPPIRPGEC